MRRKKNALEMCQRERKTSAWQSSAGIRRAAIVQREFNEVPLETMIKTFVMGNQT
jgi:hypothetical protein